MNFSDWERNGWVVAHQTSSQEIQDLLAVVNRDLHDSAAKGLSDDWRLAIAYNAALQCATIALSASGYRASRDSHHFRVIQSLGLTIGADSELVTKLDALERRGLRAGRNDFHSRG